MKMLRITLEGKSYDVGVEVLDSGIFHAGAAASAQPSESALSAAVAAPAPVLAAPAPAAAAPAAPAVAAQAGPPVAAVEGGRAVASPMAGVVLKCLVRTGDQVTLNQMVLVLDAMKMETPIHAPAAGTVLSVSVREGDAVEEGHILLQIGPLP